MRVGVRVRVRVNSFSQIGIGYSALYADALYAGALYADALYAVALYADALYADALYADALYADALYVVTICNCLAPYGCVERNSTCHYHPRKFLGLAQGHTKKFIEFFIHTSFFIIFVQNRFSKA